MWHPAAQVKQAKLARQGALPSDNEESVLRPVLSASTNSNRITLLMLGRVIAPYLIATICFGIVALHDYQNATPQEIAYGDPAFGHLSNNVLLAGVWLIFLVAARQIFTLLENQLLTGQLLAFNATLEQKVAQRTGQISSLLQLAKAVNTSRNFDAVVNEAGKPRSARFASRCGLALVIGR